ncbi:MAG TPA: glycosyltransferase [Solirubrobacteraceae bacterium]|nr:glycosyltransferase [Solirubrobacteraceae bacterium]
MALTACLVSASRQNVFFAELLDALAEELAKHGVAVERAVDHFPAPRDGLAYVFVPHELLPFLMPDAHPNEHQLRRSVTICTEQPGTHWFEESAQIAARAARTVDINRMGVSALHELGIEARFLQLGYTPRWDRWHGDPGASRPIDVALLAGATQRRLTAVARCAGQLAGRRTELHLPEALVPHRADSELFISGPRKWSLLAQTKLLLNIHRGELGYFEWQRAVEAIANGCVLLSEHSLGFEPLIPGEHFISVSCDSLDVALEALLENPDRLAQIRMSAYKLLRERHPLSASVAVLAEAIAEAAGRPVSGELGDAHPPLARPKPPQLPPPAWELTQGGTDLDAMRRVMAHLPLDQRDLHSSLHQLELGGQGDGGADQIERIGAAPRETPRVSVVLTVSDQAASVRAAIDSVAVSQYTDFELLIVDDASSDGSGNRIRAALARAPWLSATLVTRARRGGLARARNLGIELAVGDLVFNMDARDVPFPHALGRLVQSLDDTPGAAFAYGIVVQAGVDGPSGLTSYLGWDAGMLRYGNFVDAMAMVRRWSVIEVGGYATDTVLSGWEDLALWCAFADRGWRGTRIPEIVACQRLGLELPGSQGIDAGAAWSQLLDRFSCLSSVAA